TPCSCIARRIRPASMYSLTIPRLSHRFGSLLKRRRSSSREGNQRHGKSPFGPVVESKAKLSLRVRPFERKRSGGHDNPAPCRPRREERESPKDRAEARR